MQNSESRSNKGNLSQQAYKGRTIHDLIVAIWVKCDGDYGKMISFLRDKKSISGEEIDDLSQKAEAAVKKMGGKIITFVDDDYPEAYKGVDNPRICYVEAGGRVIDAPLRFEEESGKKRRFYVEFCLEGVEMDSDHDYLLQSRWLDSREEAIEWCKKEFDYIDPKYISVFIVMAEFSSDDEYDIVGLEKILDI